MMYLVRPERDVRSVRVAILLDLFRGGKLGQLRRFVYRHLVRAQVEGVAHGE